MGLFDLFKKKKKEETKEEVKEEIAEIQEDNSRPFRENPCELCGKQIGTDRWTKKQGHYFHRKCFRDKEKEVSKKGQ